MSTLTAERNRARLPAFRRPRARWVLAFLVFIGACGISLGYAFTSPPIFDAINSIFPSHETITRQIEFLALPLLVALATMLWRRRLFGWCVGETLEHWRLIGLIAIVLAGAAVALLTAIGGTPYAGFPWPEWTLVPIAEEAVYRAVLLAIIVALLARAGFARGTTSFVVLAVAINAFAFGIAHINNFQYNPPVFTMIQVAYSTALGAVLAYSRIRTGSMIAPVGLHALVNFIATVV